MLTKVRISSVGRAGKISHLDYLPKLLASSEQNGYFNMVLIKHRLAIYSCKTFYDSEYRVTSLLLKHTLYIFLRKVFQGLRAPFLLLSKPKYMSRFATKTATPTATNLAGGAAYSQSPELELVSILLTSFAQDQYYRKSDETFETLKNVIAKCDKKFVAQSAIYARTVFGMRSITHVAASELAKHIGGEKWAKDFYTKIVFRPDDMTEILAYHLSKNGKESNAMRKGLAKAFDGFDKYAIAKYRGDGKSFKLIDVVNLVHPKPTEKNKEAITALVKGELKSFDTWESELTKAGQVAESEEQKTDLKKEAWEKLIKEKKLGYLALLRNIRNIMEQAPSVLPEALQGLTNESWIKKTMIFPFQYLTAYKQFVSSNTKEARLIAQALSNAVDISCQNVKALGLEGTTLIAVDNSGSMGSPVAKSPHMQMSELGALFGIVLGKAINADIMEFGDTARYIGYNLNDHSMDFAANFPSKNKVGHGTNFHSVLQKADKKYDRIIFFSDMQGWAGGYGTPEGDLKAYNKKFDANPFIYSFDLAGYGTMQFKENRVFALAGFSDKIFDLMKVVEKDPQSIIAEIKKTEI